MPNFIRLLMVTDMGIMTLGKYTFPKIPALLLNVLEVPVKQAVK
jgi:hypothetical protein